MPKNLQNTNYKGATVSKDFAFRLSQTAVGEELFTFQPRGDKILMQARYPERGRYTPPAGKEPNPALAGKEFNIRVNMNYLVRGMVRACMDKNGDLDPNKVAELDDLRDEAFSAEGEKRENLIQAIVNKLDIPQEKRQDFETFFRAHCETGEPFLLSPDSSPIFGMFREVNGHLAQYQDAITGKMGPEAKEYAEKYRDQYENTMQSYREMAQMDPEQETRILCPLDCSGFRFLTGKFVEQNNAWREAHGLKTYKVDGDDLAFADQKRTLKEGEELRFDDHHYLTTDVELPMPVGVNGLEKKKYTISLENTAPSFGDVFDCPDVQRTGVGVYPDKDAVKQYHRDRNVRTVPDKQTYEAIMRHKPAKKGEPLPTVKMPREKTFHHYIHLHTGTAVNKLSDEKLTEYAAKVGAAVFLQMEPNEQFDLKKLHKVADTLAKNQNFRAAVREAGPENLRDMLRSGNVQDLTRMIAGTPERYHIDQNAAMKLNEYYDMMKTEGRSTEWQNLKKAVGEAEKDSAPVFDAVEKYLKGKKSVRRHQEGRDSVDLALNILSTVAFSGDKVAMERAQILVDRINEVRGAEPGSRDYVDLRDYPKYIRSMDKGPQAIEYDDILVDDPEEEYRQQQQAESAAKLQPRRHPNGSSSLQVPLAKPIEYEDVLLDDPEGEYRRQQQQQKQKEQDVFLI